MNLTSVWQSHISESESLLGVPLLVIIVKYGKEKKSDIVTLCGNHLSDKQLRKFIDELKSRGMLKTEGERGQMVYMIGEPYLENNEIMNKALEIGLKELINKGEITKGE